MLVGRGGSHEFQTILSVNGWNITGVLAHKLLAFSMFRLLPFIYNMLSIFSGHCISLLPSSQFLSQHKIIDVIHAFSLLRNNYLLTKINSQKHSMGIYRVTEKFLCTCGKPVAHPGIFFRGGVQQIQFRTENRENGVLGDGSPLVRGSGGSCNLVQEISFHLVKFS